MRLIPAFWALSLTVLTCPAAQAQTPAVAADIAPVQSLVARVMQDDAAPELIVPQTASPHGYALRPSQAESLQNARLVVWMGPGLSPWLQDPLTTLADDAVRLDLTKVEGTHLLEWREEVAFEDEDHDHDHEHGHDDEGEGIDPHAWLDPENAALWLSAIAEELAKIDPAGADFYRANAAAGQAELAALQAEIVTALEPIHDLNFVVSHDAFHYFEARFDIHSVAAVTDGDAAPAGASRLSQLRTLMTEKAVKCVLVEPQDNVDRLKTILGEEAGYGVLDPLGRAHPVGATLYPALLRTIAHELTSCAAS